MQRNERIQLDSIERRANTAIADTTRSHYPTDSPYLKELIPYRNVIPLEQRVREQAYTVDYVIGRDFDRFHGNPPIWEGFHTHKFRVEITLSSQLNPGDLYAVDMIEAEKTLELLCNNIPHRVNELLLCPTGTTEEMAFYFMRRFSLPDPLVSVKQVMVSETNNRKTILYPPEAYRGVQ